MRRTSKDEQEGMYCQYKQKGDEYYPTTKTIKTIPAGFYKPAQDSYSGEYFLQAKKIITPKLYLLPNEAKDVIVSDIQRFWNSEERYRKFQSVYKRNILLYSVPCNGKTCLINILCNELIEKYNGIVICIDTQRELDFYKKVMGRFRQVEPGRKIITVIEDFERLAKDEYFSALLLQILDGNEQLDSIVTIATTNYPESLEKRFTCRPSRFNLVLEYKKPNKEVRKFYITNKLKDGGIDVESEEVKKDIDRYVEKTEGYTFDFVKEVIQGIYIDDIDEETVFDRINKAIEHNGIYKVSEDDGRKIGFHTGEKLESCCNPVIAEDEPMYGVPDYDEDYEDDGDCGPYPDDCQVPGRNRIITPLHER